MSGKPQGNGKIRLLFHLNTHSTAQEAEEVGKGLKEFKPHVVCIEEAGASEEIAQKVEREFSKPNPFFYEPDPYYETLHRKIRQANARVFVPERFSEKEAEEMQWTDKLVYQLQLDAINQFLAGKPAAALRSYKEHLETHAANETKRDTQLKKVISNLHDEIVAKFPELTREPEIRVAFAYGVGHSPLFFHAKRSGFASVERKILKLPYRFSAAGTHARKAAFEKPLNLDDKAVARGLISTMLSMHAGRTGANTTNSRAYADLITRKLTLERFQRLSQQMGNELATRKPKTREEAAPIRSQVFQNEGIKIPETKKEVHDTLRKAGIRVRE